MQRLSEGTSDEAIYINPIGLLPKEIILSILGLLDSISLCRAAQVSTRWKDLAYDDMLWRRICQRHGYGRKPSDTRHWKVVYRDRMDVERNWRCGRCITRTLTGHTRTVSCLQFNETLSNPSFPVLISGSYDSTIRVWNMDTGAEWHCLRGHTGSGGVRALQFDDVKLITGGWDCTLKVWDWRRGECIQTLIGHSHEVLCLNYDGNLLASGSTDSTIKIWNLSPAQSVFTLEGHSDWVTAVQLWDSNQPTASRKPSEGSVFDSNSRPPSDVGNPIKPGKLLFSASYDATVKLWDLNTRTCIRVFLGHTQQVSSMALLLADDRDEDDQEKDNPLQHEQQPQAQNLLFPTCKQPILISGSLDGRIKVWDTETGKVTMKYSGSKKRGVLAIASDRTRLVTGRSSKTIKVWSRDSRKSLAKLKGHGSRVMCVALGEDKVVSGSCDCTIKIWSFMNQD